ncbi:MAG: PEP-CTERM sorting domain-containing protein [Alphaproteobacteria bacterium]|nr:PEP-CTERM sorting domain-containing protein [Alphaproteobacteria bacterium]
MLRHFFSCSWQWNRHSAVRLDFGRLYFHRNDPLHLIKFGAQDGPGALLFDDFVLRDVSVPEPFTLGIFGAGIAGAFAMRRRKHKSA